MDKAGICPLGTLILYLVPPASPCDTLGPLQYLISGMLGRPRLPWIKKEVNMSSVVVTLQSSPGPPLGSEKSGVPTYPSSLSSGTTMAWNMRWTSPP